MQQYWIAVPGGEPQGPHSVDAIRSAYASGQISGETLACPDGGTAWSPVSDLLRQAGSGSRSSPNIRNETLIHVALPDGQRRTLRADALRQLVSGGKLSPDTTQCWTEGMQDWCTARVMFNMGSGQQAEPVGSNQADRRASGAFNAQPGSRMSTAPLGTYALQVSPFGLSLALQILLWAAIPLAILDALITFIVFGSLDALREGDSAAAEALVVAGSRLEVLELVSAALFLVTGIVFLMWFHRIVTNCHGFGAQGLRFSAGGAVGFFFVPIVGLWYPRQAMDEACKASQDPMGWTGCISPALVNWWWGLWLALTPLAVWELRLVNLADSEFEREHLKAGWDAFEQGKLLSLLLSAHDIALTIVTILLVSWLTQAQRRLTRGVVAGH